MNQLHLINVFVAVVDSNGFAGAARKLALSPPAITRAVNELESHLGMRLLTRTTRVVRVTEAGARYADDCRVILAQLTEADAAVSGLNADPRGRLVITAPGMFGARFVTPIVTEYLQRHSKVSMTCNFVDRAVNMMDEGIDIAIQIGELPDSSMQAICVGRVRRVICGNRSYLAQHGTPRTLDDLAEHSIVALDGTASGQEWQMVEAGAARAIRVQPRMMTTSHDAATSAVLAGFGLTQLLSFEIEEHLRDGRLTAVLSDFEPTPMPVHLLHREGRYASAKARAFLDLAIERLRAHPALNEQAPRPRPVLEGRLATRPLPDAWSSELRQVGSMLAVNGSIRASRFGASAAL